MLEALRVTEKAAQLLLAKAQLLQVGEAVLDILRLMHGQRFTDYMSLLARLDRQLLHLASMAHEEEPPCFSTIL